MSRSDSVFCLHCRGLTSSPSRLRLISAFNAVHGGLDKLRGEALSAADAAGDQAKETQTTGTAVTENKNVSISIR